MMLKLTAAGSVTVAAAAAGGRPGRGGAAGPATEWPHSVPLTPKALTEAQAQWRRPPAAEAATAVAMAPGGPGPAGHWHWHDHDAACQ